MTAALAPAGRRRRALHVNPVLARELRQRARSRRATVVLTLYLAVLVVAIGLIGWGIDRSSSSSSGATQGVGQTVLGSVLFLVLTLTCFIVPGIAASAVAGERERLTLVPLQVTLLSPGQILRGKLLASLAFTTLLLVATLPLLAVAYVIGGVTVGQIGGGLLLVFASAAFVGVLSLWASTVLRRVQGATVSAYALVGLLVLGTVAAYGVQSVATRDVNDPGWKSLLFFSPNPYLVTADALGHNRSEGGGGSPFTPLQGLLQERDQRQQPGGGFGGFGGVAGFGGVGVPGGATVATAVTGVPSFAPPAVAAPVGQVTTTITAVPSESEGSATPVTTVPFTAPVPNGPVFGPGPLATAPPPPSPGATGGPFRTDGPPPGFQFVPPHVRTDLTDRGPIWAWSLLWWTVVGGAAYLHARRRLRLPTPTGVRP